MEASEEEDEPKFLTTKMEASDEEAEDTMRPSEHLQRQRRRCVCGLRILTTTNVAFLE